MIYPVEDFDFDSLHFEKLKRKPGYKGKKEYADVVCALDIETSYHPAIEQNVLYIWQFAIGETVIYGRYWSDYLTLLHEIKKRLGGLWLVVYIHHASFEFHHLSGVYVFRDYEVFCTDSRKVLKFEMFKAFEYRCSAKLSNMSLDAFTHKYCTKYVKLTGTVDHNKERFPDEPIEPDVLAYAVNDVLSLVEAVQNIMKLFDDDLYTIPLTATGYVRREMKSAMSGYHLSLRDKHPDYKCYKLLRAAFRGGNTHANRFYSEYILDNVGSDDESSAYPAAQCNQLFPVGHFREKCDHSNGYLNHLIERNTPVPFVMRAAFHKIRLRYYYNPVPYIPVDKCGRLIFPAKGICKDNGRVLEAEYLTICITDIDYQIIVNQYEWEKLEVLDLYTSRYDYLPEPLRELNIRFFREKTKLKGVKGQELYYMKSKNLLNAIFGCSVQEEVKETILFDNCEYTPAIEQKLGLDKLKESAPFEYARAVRLYRTGAGVDGQSETTAEIMRLLDLQEQEFMKLYKQHENVLYTQYAFGVWTTSRARQALQYGIDLCGDNLVYCDTDSVKYVGKVDFTDYNNNMIALCKKSGAYATDPQGITHYMGVFEHDADYKRFVTMGAKRYAYEDEDGLHTTISGVSKKAGAAELAAHGGLEAFRRGFVFQNTGKLEAVYNDENMGNVVIDGHKLEVTRNIVLRPTTYTLGETDDYAELLTFSHEQLNAVHKTFLNLIV